MSQKNAIVLGGTYPHIELINQLKERGYFVILIDYLPNPTAKNHADIHIMESTLDKDKVLKIARENQVQLVISTCIDQANVTACYVGEKLNLPVPYSYETGLLVSDKSLMKRLMIKNGINTAKYFELIKSEAEDFKRTTINMLNFPLIVKPCDSNGSKGVVKINDLKEFEMASSNAFSITRNGKILVEEYIEGIEIGVDGLVCGGSFEIILSRERVKTTYSKQTNSLQQIYGSYWPAQLNDLQEKDLRENISKIIQVFGLKNTPLMVQAIVKEDQIFIIEFAPRIGGGENYEIIKRKTGFDHIEAAIKSFLGEELSVHLSPDPYIYFDNYIYAKEGTFGSVSGFDPLLAEGIIDYAKTYKQKGDRIGGEITSSNRIGVFVAKDKSREALDKKVKRAFKEITLLDDHQNDMKKRV